MSAILKWKLNCTITNFFKKLSWDGLPPSLPAYPPFFSPSFLRVMVHNNVNVLNTRELDTYKWFKW